MSDPADRPNVITYPPLVYLAVLVIGLVLDWVWPLRLSLPTWARWGGVAAMLAAVAFGGLGRFGFARARTNANPMQPATALVTSGAFRWSRNPMYVGMTALLVGIALWSQNAWVLILLVPALAVMHWGVVLREERYLVRKFGAEYDAYRARVRRYF